MAEVTYYVAMPFIRTDDGDLVPGEAVECPTASAAIREAERLGHLHAGAVAFSRSGDPSTGEFRDAEILRSIGDVPSIEELLSAD